MIPNENPSLRRITLIVHLIGNVLAVDVTTTFYLLRTGTVPSRDVMAQRLHPGEASLFLRQRKDPL